MGCVPLTSRKTYQAEYLVLLQNYSSHVMFNPCLELKRYPSKVRVFWNAWAIGFQMVKLKNLSCTKIIVHGGTLLKSFSAVGFLEKPSFWESVSFHREMFCVTNFLLVLCICIVNAMIFIKKTLINLFRISFYNLLKIIHVINLAMLEKLCLVFFFKSD